VSVGKKLNTAGFAGAAGIRSATNAASCVSVSNAFCEPPVTRM
jgi:hypothetical protein